MAKPKRGNLTIVSGNLPEQTIKRTPQEEWVKQHVPAFKNVLFDPSVIPVYPETKAPRTRRQRDEEGDK